jgi:hypothetical protein
MILPRQARDEHGKVEKREAFFAGAALTVNATAVGAPTTPPHAGAENAFLCTILTILY